MGCPAHPVSCGIQDGHHVSGQLVGACSAHRAAMAEGGVLQAGGEQALSGVQGPRWGVDSSLAAGRAAVRSLFS